MKESMNPIVALFQWLAKVAFTRWTRGVQRKRKRIHQTRMPGSRGRRLDAARRASVTGSVEKVGFRRSDPRRPKHALHMEYYHPKGVCDCVGVGHAREALKLP